MIVDDHNGDNTNYWRSTIVKDEVIYRTITNTHTSDRESWVGGDVEEISSKTSPSSLVIERLRKGWSRLVGWAVD